MKNFSVGQEVRNPVSGSAFKIVAVGSDAEGEYVHARLLGDRNDNEVRVFSGAVMDRLEPVNPVAQGVACPACSSKRIAFNQVVNGVSHMKVCRQCNAVFGSCYKGDSYSIVKYHFPMIAECPENDMRYFDLDMLGSKGVERFHGWMQASSGRLVQIG